MEIRLRIRRTMTGKHLTKIGLTTRYYRYHIHSVPIQELQKLGKGTWRLERDLERGELTLVLQPDNGR